MDTTQTAVTPAAPAAAAPKPSKVATIFAGIEEIAGDLAMDTVNPVVATYGVEAEILAATIQGLLGLFHKTKMAAPVAPAA